MGNLFDATSEEERLQALRRYSILDTPAESAYDRLNSLAARLMGVPVAMITFVDRHRIWIKAKIGVEMQEVDREAGLCSRVILGSEPYVVENAALDPRTATHPLVTGGFGMRFYAGVPLSNPEGFRLGTLCVVDRKPREITSEEVEVLVTLGKLVTELLELSFENQRLTEENQKHVASIQERDQLLGDVAHDLRNPLNAIILNGNILAEEKVGPLNAMQGRMVHSLCEAGALMLQTLADCVTLSCLAPDTLRLFRRPGSFHEIVADSVQNEVARQRVRDLPISYEQLGEIAYFDFDIPRMREAVELILGQVAKQACSRVRVIVDGTERSVFLEIRGEDESKCSVLGHPVSFDCEPPKRLAMSLRIAQRIVISHGGRMILSSKSSNLLSVRVEIPFPS